MGTPRAVVFDVFGTLVDWYSSIGEHAARLGVPVDPGAFAVAWRERYRPSMDEVRSGRRPWCDLDQLHRESLPEVLAGFGVELGEADREELVQGWHRLRAWPGVPAALRELREVVPVSTLSNGHVRLLLDLARYAGLDFDTLISAELAGGYKPDPHVYLNAARLLGVAPEDLLLVACHPSDLAAAKETGLATAYLPRPREWGPDTPAHETPDVDYVLTDIAELAPLLSGRAPAAVAEPPRGIEPFSVHFDDKVLDDLRARIRATRWPDQIPGIGWRQGTELGWLRGILDYWADGFDWRARERELNAYPQFLANFDGEPIHFVHQRAKGGDGIPLLLTHGWPSTFAEFLPLVPLLTDPIEGPAFDVVIPSLPGYAFSGRPARTGVTMRETARRWHRLMGELGYARYGAHGGDFGAGVSAFLALDRPESVIGLHLSDIELLPHVDEAVKPLSDKEKEYRARRAEWSTVERGYSEIQATKPQTLGYGLNDSPAGLAAWILEKWRSWSDCGGDPETRFTRDFLLTTLTLYWATGTITPSIRDYYDSRNATDRIRADDFIGVPTGIARYSGHFAHEGEFPREWVERLYNVQRWTPMREGGHFPAREDPEPLARDIAAFFADRVLP